MPLTRKKYIVDKKFQYQLSFKAIIFPLLSFISISIFLLFFAEKNNQLINLSNDYIDEIVDTQDSMIDMFLSTPALQQSKNPITRRGVDTFKKNIGKLKKIKNNSREIMRNSTIFFYILIAMTIFQSIIIFLIFIILSHRISGPIRVMTGYLEDIKNGKRPRFRPLRKKDELKLFYENLREVILLLYEHDKKDD